MVLAMLILSVIVRIISMIISAISIIIVKQCK